MAAPSGTARAAGLIAALTLAARIVGFGRIFVFASVVGLTVLGNLYQSINTLPNIVFEIVAGGALASVVVPLLAGAVERRDTATVNGTYSALLTWAVTVLTPLSVAVAVLAGPIVTLVLGDRATAAEIEVGTRMLWVFAPQLVLYGVGIVVTGVLQAHHRFAGPALAPLLSSVTVIGAYLLFGAVAGWHVRDLAGLSLPAELILSVGTTLGVAVLALSLLVPLRPTGVRFRPTFRFPGGGAAKARSLVGSGIATVVGQQLALLVVVLLTQKPAPVGATLAYTLTQTMFLLPWAVLAVPVATAAFPRLAAAHASGDTAGFARTLATNTRAVLLLCAVAAAALVATARPVGEVVSSFADGNDPAALGWAIAAFAPGLLGYGLLALLTRALYAAGVARATAVVTTIGWTAVIVADVVLAVTVPIEHRVAALAAGHTVGMTVLGAGLLVLTARRCGGQSLAGAARTGAVALIAATLATVAGIAAAGLIGGSGVAAFLAQGILGGVTVIVVFVAVAALGDPDDVRPLLRRVASRIPGVKIGDRS